MPWTLVTAPDERERCMVVEDGERCDGRTEWLVGDLAGLDYAYVCDRHVGGRPASERLERVG